MTQSYDLYPGNSALDNAYTSLSFGTNQTWTTVENTVYRLDPTAAALTVTLPTSVTATDRRYIVLYNTSATNAVNIKRSTTDTVSLAAETSMELAFIDTDNIWVPRGITPSTGGQATFAEIALVTRNNNWAYPIGPTRFILVYVDSNFSYADMFEIVESPGTATRISTGGVQTTNIDDYVGPSINLSYGVALCSIWDDGTTNAWYKELAWTGLTVNDDTLSDISVSGKAPKQMARLNDTAAGILESDTGTWTGNDTCNGDIRVVYDVDQALLLTRLHNIDGVTSLVDGKIAWIGPDTVRRPVVSYKDGTQYKISSLKPNLAEVGTAAYKSSSTTETWSTILGATPGDGDYFIVFHGPTNSSGINMVFEKSDTTDDGGSNTTIYDGNADTDPECYLFIRDATPTTHQLDPGWTATHEGGWAFSAFSSFDSDVKTLALGTIQSSVDNISTTVTLPTITRSTERPTALIACVVTKEETSSVTLTSITGFTELVSSSGGSGTSYNDVWMGYSIDPTNTGGQTATMSGSFNDSWNAFVFEVPVDWEIDQTYTITDTAEEGVLILECAEDENHVIVASYDNVSDNWHIRTIDFPFETTPTVSDTYSAATDYQENYAVGNNRELKRSGDGYAYSLSYMDSTNLKVITFSVDLTTQDITVIREHSASNPENPDTFGYSLVTLTDDNYGLCIVNETSDNIEIYGKDLPS
jgi:hypothetical protein